MAADAETAARSTYRLQLGPELDLHGAAELVDYLAALGVTHVYCSPVLQARTGSPHGYDVADPTRLSEELGGEAGFARLVESARAHGLGLLVDVVPNHLGVGSDNPLWELLLAEGAAGAGARFFDVDWSPALPGAAGKVILPVLGTPYGTALHAGELRIVGDRGGPRLSYHDRSFPLSGWSRDALDAGEYEGTADDPESWAGLHALLETQHYRLVHWRVGSALVNYRRFFAIDELAAVRVEDPSVFARTHAKVLDLVRTGAVDGLRIDHVDGLTDPTGYLTDLRAAVGDGVWIVCEKILAPDEEPPEWPVGGTTGYEFLAFAVGLFVDPAAERSLTETAREFHAWPHAGALAEELWRAKREVLEEDLLADSERLVETFWALTQRHVDVRDVTRAACRSGVLAALAALDVYRVYTRPGEEPAPSDAARVEAAVAEARRRARDVPDFLWPFLEAFLLGRAGDDALAAEALRRFHQVASAATAKGVEDTLLYRQHRLAALNDVGVEPDIFGSTVASFHAANARRAERYAEGLLTTATHDTKRGEDVRLRVAALSEIPDLWADTVRAWREQHQDGAAAGSAPDPAMAYLCYQTLVGVWPPAGATDLDDVRRRVGAYLVKAAREAGLRTSWVAPDEDYEAMLVAFVARLLDPEAAPGFIEELAALARRTGEIAMLSGLSQVLLRTTSPGVPDTYQGTELWEDSLVDPDNRRPVDFAARRSLLEALDAGPADITELVERRADGRLKLWVLSRALRARAAQPGCFGPGGGYDPLVVEGSFANRVVAFVRTDPRGPAAVVIATRLAGPLIGDTGQPPLGSAWSDTRVVLPPAVAGRRWVDALGGPGSDAGEGHQLAGVLADLPVALLLATEG